MADRFPELSETDFTSLVDQKNRKNIKKATKRLTVSTIWGLKMKLCWEGNQFISAVSRLVQGSVRLALPENNNTEKKKQTNKQTRWSNDKTIIELGSRKILWFDSVYVFGK